MTPHTVERTTEHGGGTRIILNYKFGTSRTCCGFHELGLMRPDYRPTTSKEGLTRWDPAFIFGGGDAAMRKDRTLILPLYEKLLESLEYRRRVDGMGAKGIIMTDRVVFNNLPGKIHDFVRWIREEKKGTVWQSPVSVGSQNNAWVQTFIWYPPYMDEKYAETPADLALQPKLVGKPWVQNTVNSAVNLGN